MAVSWCPQCKLPLTREEAQRGVCPGCGTSLRARSARKNIEQVALAPSRRSRFLARVALAAAVLAGAGTFFALRSVMGGDTPSDQHREISAAAPVVVQSGHKPWEKAASHPANPAPAAVASAGSASPIVLPIPPRTDPPIAGPVVAVPGAVQQLDNPDGDHIIKSISGGQVIKLAGRVHALKIGSISGKSVLDASALQARYILVGGRIDGESIVRLCAPQGKVEFCSPIAGRSQVEVLAPGGEIWFGPQGMDKKVTRISGNSIITLLAREVQIRGKIAGSRVDATLTPGGRLHFVELSATATLRYRKSTPADPPPFVEKGILAAGATLTHLQ